MLKVATKGEAYNDLGIVVDNDNVPMADRCKAIVRALSAIVTTGITTSWSELTYGLVNTINISTRETIGFTTSVRNRALTGSDTVLTHKIMVARGRNVSQNPPEPTDWTIDELLDWIQHLPAELIAKLPEPNFQNPAIAALNEALVTNFGQKVELIPGRAFIASHDKKADLITLKIPGFGTGRFCNANDVLTLAR
ncbi:hypothetical protein [Erythrobacter aureus]|uniref:Uncharacterized protein n=1 Tax=Erythrobacter aureus TaxID=2182384 RepID=A0A345YIU0_9SPHN|nr:hypothetical protein [Erythrobacter aureus]AXK43842.1 hypothetical protein DVR09_15415 [Erythrobacter aureus]